MANWYRKFSLSRLSIQKRLPLLICALLLSAILIFSLSTYYALKKATLAIGRDRLTTLTNQMSSLFGQSAQVIIKKSISTANQKDVLELLETGKTENLKETIDALDKMHRDSTYVSVQLLNHNLQPVLRSTKSTTDVKVNMSDVLAFTHIGVDSGKVGKIYNVHGTMYYPLISAVTSKSHIIGYLVSWVKVQATAKAVAQLSQLVGTGASFYIVNSDKSLWTNMIKIVPKPPFTFGRMGESIKYVDGSGSTIMADVRPIGHTDWLIAIAFPEKNVLSGITSFLRLMSIIGVVLTIIGMLAAWVMSRNITKPLKQLTAAATAISEGNYSPSISVDVYNTNELGQLADAFNIMKAQVYNMHHELEKKVIERTAQLENVNKELEAFSYSVSHDLRTPLRAVNGYAIMLKEDYEEKLDAEGHRIIRNIISNAKMMGQLIDDLLAFSRLGKKELKRSRIDMQSVVKTVVNELLQHEPENKYSAQIAALPAIDADEVMIKQAFINLVGNAIKYSSKKKAPEIEIGFIEQETKIIYYVKDNGAGFDMAYADKLFGVFQRLHSQEEFEGSGVGLALVKRIIEKHTGEIWAEGVENTGATFYFSLPKP